MPDTVHISYSCLAGVANVSRVERQHPLLRYCILLYYVLHLSDICYTIASMSTQIAIRTDEITKETINEFAKSLGLSTSAFMLAAAKESMKRGSVKVTPQYNPEFVKMIREAEAEYARGEYAGPFKTTDEALAYLNGLTEDGEHDEC